MRKASLGLVLAALLTLSGCSVADWFMGADEPEPVPPPPIVTTTDEGVTVIEHPPPPPPKKAPIDVLADFVGSLGPWGQGGAVGLALAAEAYRRRRKAAKA